IADLGLAKRLEGAEQDRLSLAGQIVGPPSYRAPEQPAGSVGQIGPPADVYALGAILYEMLTGRPPFKGTDASATLEQVRSSEVVPPSRLQPRIARDLETICLKCLRKEPAKRYGSAEELAEDLRRFLAHLPIRARRPSPWEAGAKWVRRHPAAAILIGLFVVSAAILSAFAVRSDSQRRARERQQNEHVARRRSEFERTLDAAGVFQAKSQWPEA